MNKFKVIIIHNIISPYKTILFNSLFKITKNFKVLYLAKNERIREWKVDRDKLQFEFDILFNANIDDINTIKISIKLYRKLNFYNPEIIIVGGYSYFAHWVALFWAKRHKRKVIVMSESHYLDKKRFLIKENFKKIFISQCTAALVAGTRHKDYLLGLGMKSENIFIMKGVGNVNLKIYENNIMKFKKDKLRFCNELGVARRNFLYVGRFSPEKNLIFLLKCFKKIKNIGINDWGMILVGDGPQRKEIENFIKKRKIKNIFLPGFIQKEDLPFYYALADCFILPSISEAWGLVVNEAMACGLPVLVSNRCGCYPDIVHDGENGFSFDPFEEHELFRIMKDIIQEKYDLKKMGRASSNILKGYTIEKTANIFMEAINFAIEKK